MPTTLEEHSQAHAAWLLSHKREKQKVRILQALLPVSYTHLIPATLRELGIPEDMLETMAKSAPKGGDTIHGVKPLHWKDVYEIYKLAY